MGARLAVALGVPSQLHEVIVEMFRTRPELARELLEACAGLRLAYGVWETASIDRSQAVPSEYRADAVTVMRDVNGKVRAAIIVEVQLAVDVDKAWTWPVHVSTLRARLRVPVILFVLARDEVAMWARRSIELGHPGFALAPIVVALSEVPRVTEPAVAARAPELAVLSVLGHREREVGYAAVEGCVGLDEDSHKLYLDLILAALPEDEQRHLEAMMIKGYQYQSDFARRYFEEGRQLGLQVGREEGREEGREQAREEAMRLASAKSAELLCQKALEMARERLGTVTVEQEQWIRGLNEPQVVAELIAGVACVSEPAALDALLARLAAGRSHER
jgi:hypothetical protein